MTTNKNKTSNHSGHKLKKTTNYWRFAAIGLAIALTVTLAFDINISVKPRGSAEKDVSVSQPSDSQLAKTVFSETGISLPVQLSEIVKEMLNSGVIDQEKLESLYSARGKELSPAEKDILYGSAENLTINSQNAAFMLNLLWAFGLSNKNPILEQGPMVDPKYGGADRFASTGGWPLSEGNVMDHYSKHAFISLTQQQQELVERVAKNIYRPCCGNSTYFPDCNHGMAMLGLLELMAAQGANENQMYKTALQVNSYWFPDTYLTLAKYFAKRGVDWNEVEPKTVLGSAYSSAQGYKQILNEIEPPSSRGRASCGV